MPDKYDVTIKIKNVKGENRLDAVMRALELLLYSPAPLDVDIRVEPVILKMKIEEQ